VFRNAILTAKIAENTLLFSYTLLGKLTVKSLTDEKGLAVPPYLGSISGTSIRLHLAPPSKTSTHH